MMLMRLIGLLRFSLAAAFFAFACSDNAFAEDWTELPTRTQKVAAEGVDFTIPIRPQLKVADGAVSGLHLQLRSIASLSDFQDKADDILAAAARRESSCETRWSFPQLDRLTYREDRLRLLGQIRVEVWVCNLIKTRVARETASFALSLYPFHTPETLSFKAELDHFDLGKSILGGLGVKEKIRSLLERQLSRALDSEDMRLGFPDEVAAFKPRFDSAKLVGSTGDNAELHIEASARVTAAGFQQLIPLITK